MNFELLLNNLLTLKAFYYFTNDKYAVIYVMLQELEGSSRRTCNFKLTNKREPPLRWRAA